MKNTFKMFNLFEIIYMVLGTAAVVVSFCLTPEKNWLSLITALVGIFAFLFVAKGLFLAPILNIVYSVLYLFMALDQKFYGEIILCGIGILISVFAIFSWLKNRSQQERHTVEVNKISWQEYLILVILSVPVTFGLYFMLRAIGTAQAVVGAISMILSIDAEYLSFRRSSLYSVGFILNDVVVVILWCFTLRGSGTTFLPSIISFGVFFVNDVYGLVNWSIMKKKQTKAQVS